MNNSIDKHVDQCFKRCEEMSFDDFGYPAARLSLDNARLEQIRQDFEREMLGERVKGDVLETVCASAPTLNAEAIQAYFRCTEDYRLGLEASINQAYGEITNEKTNKKDKEFYILQFHADCERLHEASIMAGLGRASMIKEQPNP